MLEFICSTCNKRLQGDESLAGKHVLCPVCNAAMNIPPAKQAATLPTTTIATPEHASAAKIIMPTSGRDGTFREGLPPLDNAPFPPLRKEVPHILMRCLPILVVVCIVLIFIALLVPATEKVREAAARTHSLNNVKQIVLAMQNFHDVNTRLPFNGTQDAIANDNKSGSWAFQILPFIDQTPMFTGVNRATGVPAYMCPGRGRPTVEIAARGGGAWTDYFYNNYINNPQQAAQLNAPDMKRKMSDITDGTSNTVFLGQGSLNTRQYASDRNVTLSTNIFIGGGAGTMRAGNNVIQIGVAPDGVTLRRDSNQDPDIGSWGSSFPQGAFMGMGDGTVRMFPYNTENFGAFLTPAGAELVILPDT